MTKSNRALNRDIVFLKEKYNMELYQEAQEGSNTTSHAIWSIVRTKIPEAEEIGWYMVDMEVQKMLKVELIIFDMRHSYHGGRGKIIDTFMYDFSEDEEVTMLIRAYVDHQKILASKAELEKREKEERRLKILEVQAELF